MLLYASALLAFFIIYLLKDEKNPSIFSVSLLILLLLIGMFLGSHLIKKIQSLFLRNKNHH